MEQRFLSKVSVSAETGCWDWTASKTKQGYGYFGIGSKVFRAHRVSFEIYNGTIPVGMDVCHSCDNPSCVNPAHLFIGTRADNMRDCANKSRIVLPNLRGEQLPQARLTEAQVLKIKESSLSQRKLATQYGVSHRQIGRIRAGLSWAHATQPAGR